MHLDESSLDGTLSVLDSILRSTLNLTEEDIQKHGLILCAGDQLSLSLLDKVCIYYFLCSIYSSLQNCPNVWHVETNWLVTQKVHMLKFCN